MTVLEIQEAVARHYGITMLEMKSVRREHRVARARQVAMFLSRRLTSLSLPAIGNAFDGRHHTTVMHAVEKVQRMMWDAPAFHAEVNDLEKSLSNSQTEKAV